MATTGLGVIGLGVHARRGHIDHLGGLPVRLVAVCDLNAVAMHDFPVSAREPDEDALLARQDVDAVMVMTPDRFHIGTALKALAAGKHVFVEKPIIERGVDVAALLEAIGTARAKGLVLTTCHPRRLDRPFLWLRAALPGLIERFGPPLEFRFDFSYAKPRAGTAGLHRGLLLDHFGHELDLMHFLFGRAAFSANRLCDDETRYHVAGWRDDGLAFTFSGSRMLDASRYPETCAVRFARGDVSLDMQDGTARIADRGAAAFSVETCGTTDYDGRFAAVNANFIATVRGQSVSYLTDEDLLINNAAAVDLTEAGDTRWSAGAAAAMVAAAVASAQRQIEARQPIGR